MAQGTWNGIRKRIAVGFFIYEWGQLNALAEKRKMPVTSLIRELTLERLAQHD